MTIPIVIAAFGTTNRAIQTYDHMDMVFVQALNGRKER